MEALKVVTLSAASWDIHHSAMLFSLRVSFGAHTHIFRAWALSTSLMPSHNLKELLRSKAITTIG